MHSKPVDDAGLCGPSVNTASMVFGLEIVCIDCPQNELLVEGRGTAPYTFCVCAWSDEARI